MKELMTLPAKRRFWFSNTVLIIGVVVVYCAWSLGRPIAVLQPQTLPLSLTTSAAAKPLAWPSKGQAAVGMTPSGVLATNGEQIPVPTASVAKVFTALMVLKKRPLAASKTGPTITMTAADVASYERYVAGDGSVTPVQIGQKLTQYQMLQAILLPSANNIADSLAIWAFGSLENYQQFANNYIRQLGMTNTVIGSDASGYSASTVSTAHDMVLLGEAAMREPVIAEIVSQSSAVLPFAGTINSSNFLLGSDGIVGVKTGSTEEAGGVFVAAQKVTIAGKPITLVSAIAGAENRYEAVVASLPLLKSAQENFAESTLLAKGTTIGHYVSPWGQKIKAVTAKPLVSLTWQGAKVPVEAKLLPISFNRPTDSSVGSVIAPQSPVSTASKVDVKLVGSISKPSLLWRLTHPFAN